MKLIHQTRSQANHPIILRFLCIYPHQCFLNRNMYSPPKKQCLPQQSLMEVTGKEGLGWEANLATHVSKVLLVFTTFLNPLLHYIFGGKPQNNEALRRIPSVDGHFFPIRSPQFILFSCPYRTSHQGSHVLRPYENYKHRRRTLCLSR